ncbi:MAG: twin-arginine translocation pathway signal protein, partial [Hyphomicrobiaceae bacterium]
MQRRNFITLLGGGVVLAAGSATGFALTRTPTRALQPWREAGTAYTDPRMRALSYAILAPNPHNRQPWQVDLSKPDKIILRVDLTRLLPETDPFSRQITIGLGCFLELLRMAAADDGYLCITVPFPEGADASRLDDRIVAEVTFFKDATAKSDQLFRHVLNRRSLKVPFDTSRELKQETLAGIVAVADTPQMRVGTIHKAAEISEWRKLTRNALQIELTTRRTYKESVDLFRIGKAEIEANPDGISFSGPLFDTLGLLGQFTREGALDSTSSVYRQGIAAVMANVDTAMGYLWIVTPGNTRIDQIDTGRDWLRLNLASTA